MTGHFTAVSIIFLSLPFCDSSVLQGHHLSSLSEQWEQVPGGADNLPGFEVVSQIPLHI